MYVESGKARKKSLHAAKPWNLEKEFTNGWDNRVGKVKIKNIK
jgi:hypothetical protein